MGDWTVWWWWWCTFHSCPPASFFLPLEESFHCCNLLSFSASSQNLTHLLHMENLETLCAPATPLQPCRAEAPQFPPLIVNEPRGYLGILLIFLFKKKKHITLWSLRKNSSSFGSPVNWESYTGSSTALNDYFVPSPPSSNLSYLPALPPVNWWFCFTETLEGIRREFHKLLSSCLLTYLYLCPYTPSFLILLWVNCHTSRKGQSFQCTLGSCHLNSGMGLWQVSPSLLHHDSPFPSLLCHSHQHIIMLLFLPP